MTSITELISVSREFSSPSTPPAAVAVGSMATLSRPMRRKSLASDLYFRGQTHNPATVTARIRKKNANARPRNRNSARQMVRGIQISFAVSCMVECLTLTVKR